MGLLLSANPDLSDWGVSKASLKQFSVLTLSHRALGALLRDQSWHSERPHTCDPAADPGSLANRDRFSGLFVLANEKQSSKSRPPLPIRPFCPLRAPVDMRPSIEMTFIDFFPAHLPVQRMRRVHLLKGNTESRR